MISSKRIIRAEREGYNAFKATGGDHRKAEVPYHMWTAQWRAFNRGWQKARKEGKAFEFLKPVKS